MPRQLYNEGRVVGYSAYEIYISQLKSTDPSATPVSEKEWLASTLAMGSSMLLRVGSDDVSGPHYIDVQFPSTSHMSAASTILASFFLGAGYIGDDISDTSSVWATKVTDYGNLISNTSESSPNGTTTHSSSIPTKASIDISDDAYNQVVSYMNITDGIIIQPGTWIVNSDTPPEKDFQPALSDYPMIRLSFADKVETPFFVLLTGFTNKGVLVAESILTSSVDTDNPQDGDFLGPTVFPWSAKVIFSIPPFAMKSVIGNGFKFARKYQNDSMIRTVDSTPIIDFTSFSPDARDSSNPEKSKYGDIYDQASKRISNINIDINKANASVLTSYSPNGKLFPALYGTTITKDGQTEGLYPLDSVAPNSVHMYQDDDGYDAENYARAMMSYAEGTKVFVRDQNTYTINQIDSLTQELLPVTSVDKQPISNILKSAPIGNPFLYVDGTIIRPGLTMKWNGTDYSDAGHIGGTDVPNSDVNSYRSDSTKWQYWYIAVADELSYEYAYVLETIRVYTNETEYEEVQGIPGTVVMTDKLMCSPVCVMLYRRISGRLSEKIKAECGYQNVFDSDGNPIGVFAEGGIWEDASAKYLFNQIDSNERHNYYAVMPSIIDGSTAIPVKSDDNIMDVVFKYPSNNFPLADNTFNIYVNGNKWNIPHFRNNPTSGNGRDAKYLGSWKNTTTNPDRLTSDIYDNGWAKIYENGVSHPTSYSLIANQSSCQITQLYAMLPHSSWNSVTMTDVFGSVLLDSAGIKFEFQSMKLPEFLKKAMFTDMGTGQPLGYAHSNNIKLKTLLLR